MSLQFNMVALLLMILILLGIFSHNSSITISAAVLLIMQQTLLAKYIPYLEKYGLSVGIVILTIGVLSPLVSGKIQLPDLSAFVSWKMFVAIAVGVLVAWLAGKGVPLMGEQPVLVTGLVIGTIIGVSFLGGGAFAAHGLSKVLEPKELAWIETGVKYQMFHTIAILAIGILQLCRESLVANKIVNLAAGAWAYGILLFSGSLYALALGAGKFLVWVTPIGGTLFLIGWLCLAYGSFKSK